MVDRGKSNVLGVLIDAVDYEAAVARIVDAAIARRPLAVSAMAVHGVMTGRDPGRRELLNEFDMLTPDGQPVRWALNLLHGTRLRDTVRGTTLTVRVLEAAAAAELPVFFYGSRGDVLEALVTNVRARHPGLTIAGVEPSKFRRVTVEETEEIVARIQAAGARIVFVGLGCPRQETFAQALRDRLSMPLVAVGAAFDYLAGSLREPPPAVQRTGTEWLWRLSLEPRRLWRRYLLLNPAYVTLLALQATRLWKPTTEGARPLPSFDLEA